MSAPVTVTQAHTVEARRIWDAGHDKIAGQAADASWVAEKAHIATLAEYIAATEAAFRAERAELVEALEALQRHVIRHACTWDEASNGSHHHHVWARVAEALARAKASSAEGV